MTAYNVEKITKIEVCDFKEIIPRRSHMLPGIFVIKDGVTYEKPRVIICLDGGGEDVYHYETLEAAEDFARRITMSKGWITITDEP